MNIRNSGYSHHGASRTKSALLSWLSSSKSPHEDISENLSLLRERSRDLYAGGGPLGRGAIDRLALNTAGSGLKLNVRIDPELLGMTDEDARSWSAKVESEFDYWASSKECDISRRLNFYELQVLALKSMLLDGDCLVVMSDRKPLRGIYHLTLRLIESECMADPVPIPPGVMVDEGVELDETGSPVAYWIASRNPNQELPRQKPVTWGRVAIYGEESGRRNVLHLMNPERIGQNRGVPFLAPVIEQLKQLGRYTDAELMAAVVSGMYAVFFEHEFRPEGTIGEEEYASEEGLGEYPGLEGLTQQEMYGLVMDLPEGVKPTSVSPSRPNTSFDAFVSSLVRQIGGCLGIPSELLTLHFTASYSASRGALLEAWKLFRYWRTWLAENFCQAVYEEWLTEAVMLGRVNAPGYFEDDYRRSLYAWSEWTGPAQGQLNPVQEVEASILKVEHGFSTHQRETSELCGGDYDLNVRQLEREQGMRGMN